MEIHINTEPHIQPTILQHEDPETGMFNVVVEFEVKSPPPVCVDKFTDTELDYEAVLKSGEDMGVWADMYKCVQSPRVDTEKMAYDLHVKDGHTKKRHARYICDYCNTRFHSFNRFTMHMSLRHKHGLPVSDKDCYCSFKTRRAFMTHKRVRHTTYTSPSQPRDPAGIWHEGQFHPRLITFLITTDKKQKINQSRQSG